MLLLMSSFIFKGSNICDNSLIMSFGLTGNVITTPINSLCPRVKGNCCTKED